MPSNALEIFVEAVREVGDLEKAAHPTLARNAPDSLRLARAVSRGQIVLLSSHFERYIRSVNEEAITHLNRVPDRQLRVPQAMRLLHSSSPVDEIAKMAWDNRAEKLSKFSLAEGWLWGDPRVGELQHDKLLAWMKAPDPKSLIRYYKYWGVADIFSAVTKTPVNRSRLFLAIEGLVDLRNNIAHGDYTAQATKSDVRQYRRDALVFTRRADRSLAKRMKAVLGLADLPWPDANDGRAAFIVRFWMSRAR